MIIRNAGPEDRPRVDEIDRLAVEDLRQVYRPTDAALQLRSHAAPSLGVLVAEIDRLVVGVVQYRVEGTRLWLLGLGVDPAFRRRGAAAALLQRLVRIARDSACTTVALHTVRETGNVAMFERLGFTVESEEFTDLFVSERFGKLSEVVMFRRVDDSVSDTILG